MSGLLAAINGGLTGSGLIAQDDGGVIRIVEISSPGVAVPLHHHSCLRQYLATARYLQLVQPPAAEALR